MRSPAPLFDALTHANGAVLPSNAHPEFGLDESRETTARAESRMTAAVPTV